MSRSTLLGLTVAGLIGIAAVGCQSGGDKGSADCKCMKAGEKGEHDEGGMTEEKVAVEQLPPAVVAAVKAEVPGGTITEAEKVTKKGKTYYSMDVTAGAMKYDLKTTLDGKFVSKKVDDDADEHDGKGEHEEMGEHH